MDVYTCKQEFQLEFYDENDASTGYYQTIPAGSTWFNEGLGNVNNELSPEAVKLHLMDDPTKTVKMTWIEIQEPTLRENFNQETGAMVLR